MQLQFDLEVQLEAELQLTHRSARAGNASETGTAQVIIGIAPVRMVRGVEGLEAELQGSAFREVEVLQQRRVELDQPRPDHYVPTGGTEGAERLQLKRGGIEPLIGSALIALKVGFADQIRTVKARAGVRAIGSGRYGYREAGLDRQQRAEFPAAQRDVSDPAIVHPPAAFPERQLE